MRFKIFRSIYPWNSKLWGEYPWFCQWIRADGVGGMEIFATVQEAVAFTNA